MLQISVKSGVIRFAGVLDDTFPSEHLLRQARPLLLDFEAIDAINSVGVRQFILFVAKLRPGELELHNLSYAFVDALNSIASMLGQPPNAKFVKSILIDATCKTCDVIATQTLVFNDWDFYNEVGRIEPEHCESCGRLMDHDESPEDMLTFLRAET